MSDADRDARFIHALRGHYRVIERTHNVSPQEGVRLVYALVCDHVVQARDSGVDDDALGALFQQGEAIASASAPTAPPKEEPPSPQSPSQETDDTPVRRHPRFVSREEVLVALEGREELRSLWTRDISSGGLFIATDTPPPLETTLRITLQTPDGSLELHGVVVHVLDQNTATPMGMEPGVGVQFSDLTDARRQALTSYIDGVAQQLEERARSEAVAIGDEDRRLAQRFLRFVDASKLYEAVELSPKASPEEITARIDELRQTFDDGARGAPPTHRPQFQNARRVLDRLSLVLRTPERRLAYDLTQGTIDVEERYLSCLGNDEDPAALRSVWLQVHPEKTSEAKRIVARAKEAAEGHDYVIAMDRGRDALALDPFNTDLRDRITQWEVLQVVARECKDGSLDPVARLAWAHDRGVHEDFLREMWMTLFPDRFEHARQLGQQALLSERVGKLEEALTAAHGALDDDPFNRHLRATIVEWKRRMDSGTVDKQPAATEPGPGSLELDTDDSGD